MDMRNSDEAVASRLMRAAAEDPYSGCINLDHDGRDIDAPKAERAVGAIVLSSAAFTAGFIPPDYLLDGILQRRFIYSLTAPTGRGKTAVLLRLAAHVALNQPIGAREVQSGRVLYLAGENPDDVRMRWIAMAEKMDFDIDAIEVHFIPGTFSIPDMSKRIQIEVEAIGGVDLVIVDTSAAYYHGADENSNTEMGKHARMLRQLTTMPGRPCVIVACHPTKNAANDNLLPRGGGAFVAEVDGNLTALKRDSIVDLHWQGKFRGPDFEAIGFRLETVTCDRIRDSRDRRIPSVISEPITEADRADMSAAEIRAEDQLIILLAKDAFSSIRNTAEALNWFGRTGEPQKSKVQATLIKLKREGLAEQNRNKWKLTAKGKEEAKRLADLQPQEQWNARSNG